jgi:hypothetical protein
MKGIDHIFFSITNVSKESLNSDGQQFHQYQQNVVGSKFS